MSIKNLIEKIHLYLDKNGNDLEKPKSTEVKAVYIKKTQPKTQTNTQLKAQTKEQPKTQPKQPVLSRKEWLSREIRAINNKYEGPFIQRLKSLENEYNRVVENYNFNRKIQLSLGNKEKIYNLKIELNKATIDYSEAKNQIETERYEAIKNSFFHEDQILKREYEKEYNNIIELEKMKSYEISESEKNRALNNIKDIEYMRTLIKNKNGF